MGSSLLVIYGGEGTFYGFKPARNRFSGLLLLMKLIVTFQKKKWVFSCLTISIALLNIQTPLGILFSYF